MAVSPPASPQRQKKERKKKQGRAVPHRPPGAELGLPAQQALTRLQVVERLCVFRDLAQVGLESVALNLEVVDAQLELPLDLVKVALFGACLTLELLELPLECEPRLQGEERKRENGLAGAGTYAEKPGLFWWLEKGHREGKKAPRVSPAAG